MNEIRDGFERTIDYMRVSITDRCNLRCIYCMPSGGIKPIAYREILRYEEIVRIIRVAARLGVRRVRLTGGEPLVRKNIPCLIQQIKDIEGIQDLSLTTNGILLDQYADKLAEAGLDRVNVSLDSLHPGRFREITKGRDIGLVLKGIESAERAGLVPIKINMVPIRGINDDEVLEFARLTFLSSFQVRFIEFMPFGSRETWSPERFIPSDEIRAAVEKIGPLTPVNLGGSGPARYYRFDGAVGVIGFISPLSDHFCSECNRLRLTSDGKLRPCLFSETEIDLKTAIRSGAPDDEVQRLIRLAAAVKPKGHNMKIQDEKLRALLQSKKDCARPMSGIGG